LAANLHTLHYLLVIKIVLHVHRDKRFLYCSVIYSCYHAVKDGMISAWFG